MSKIAFCFPGQGSLERGMGREFAEYDPAAMNVFEQGSEAAGIDLRRLCFEAPLEELTETEVQQPALVATSLAILAALRERGVRLLAADGAGTTLLHDADLTGAHAWVMGNEAWGLPHEVREACDDVVRVPIHGHAESLNLAMAATICLYASAEARRTSR